MSHATRKFNVKPHSGLLASMAWEMLLKGNGPWFLQAPVGLPTLRPGMVPMGRTPVSVINPRKYGQTAWMAFPNVVLDQRLRPETGVGSIFPTARAGYSMRVSQYQGCQVPAEPKDQSPEVGGLRMVPAASALSRMKSKSSRERTI